MTELISQILKLQQHGCDKYALTCYWMWRDDHSPSCMVSVLSYFYIKRHKGTQPCVCIKFCEIGK